MVGGMAMLACYVGNGAKMMVESVCADWYLAP